jgi:hypothetical protein
MKSRKHEIIAWDSKGPVPIAKIVGAVNRLETQVDLYEIVDTRTSAFGVILVRHSLLKSEEKKKAETLSIARRKFPTAKDVILHRNDEWGFSKLQP